MPEYAAPDGAGIGLRFWLLQIFRAAGAFWIWTATRREPGRGRSLTGYRKRNGKSKIEEDDENEDEEDSKGQCGYGAASEGERLAVLPDGHHAE